MSAVLRVRIGRGTVAAKAVRGHHMVWAGSAVFESPDDLREAIAQLAAEESLPVRVGGLRVKLETPLAQVRTLEHLPPVRSSALKALVAQQAGRFFRRNGKPLVTDAVWLRRPRGQPAVAQAAAVEEPWVDAIAAGARAAGLVLEEIHPASGDTTLKRLSLVSAAERAHRKRLESAALRRLAAITAILWIVAASGFVIRVQREHREVDRRLAALKAPLAAVGAARRELAGATLMVETIEAGERNRASLLRHLASITAALPDSAYLTSFSLGEDGGTMSGLARQATSVMAAFEKEAAIAAPRLTGPVIREVIVGKELERFTLTFARGPEP